MKKTALKRFALVMLFAFSFQFSHALYVAVYCYVREGAPNRYLRAWCSIARNDYGSEWLNRTWTPPSTGEDPNQLRFRVASPEELSDGAIPPSNLAPASSEQYAYIASNWEVGPTGPLPAEVSDFVINNFANSSVTYELDPYLMNLDQVIDMGVNSNTDFFGVKILGNPADKGKIDAKLISVKEQDVTLRITTADGTFTKEKTVHLSTGINDIKFNWNENKYGQVSFQIISQNNTYTKNILVQNN